MSIHSTARPISVLALTILIPLSSAVMTFGQETGIITGIVEDAETGQPLPGANIHLAKHSGLGTTSGSEGRFRLSGVPTGQQTLRVTYVGYQSSSHSLQITSSDTTYLEISLQPAAAVMEGIEVSALSPNLQPEDQLEEVEVREANPRDSGELLRSVPGLEAVRRGPVGLDPVVRGLRETEVGVYLDGSRLFPGGPARMDSPLSHLDPSFVKSINVVKGPYALTWGAGNLSAIRVETQDVSSLPPGSWRTTLLSGYDTNMNSLESAISTRGRQDRMAYWVHGTWRQSSDYRAGDGTVVPADFLSREIRGKVGYQTTGQSHLTLSAGYQRQDDIDYPGRLLNAEFFDTQNYAARWELERSTGLLRSVEALTYFNRVAHGMTNDGKPTAEADSTRMPPFPLRVRVDARVNVWGGRLSTLWMPGPDWDLQVGGDLYSASKTALRRIEHRETGMIPEPLRPQPDLMWPYTQTTDGGLFLRIERSFAEGLTVAGTGRVDFVSAAADTASPFFLENVSRDLRHREQNLSGALTVNKTLGRFWQATVGLGSATRTADATERYSDRIPASKAQTSAEFVGTPNLRPERSTQVDVGLEGRYVNTSLTVNAFARRLDNYVTLTPTNLEKRLPLSPETVYRYINGTARFWGLEGSLRYRPVDRLTVSVQPVYLWGRDLQVGEPALGVAPLSTILELRYEPENQRFFLQGTMQATSRQDRVARTRGEQPTAGYVTANLKGGVRITEGISLQAGITNLTDTPYTNHLNAKNPFTGQQLPEPGRIFFGDVQIRF